MYGKATNGSTCLIISKQVIPIKKYLKQTQK